FTFVLLLHSKSGLASFLGVGHGCFLDHLRTIFNPKMEKLNPKMFHLLPDHARPVGPRQVPVAPLRILISQTKLGDWGGVYLTQLLRANAHCLRLPLADAAIGEHALRKEAKRKN